MAGPSYQGQPAFVSMSGGVNKNIYNPNAAAKQAERAQSQKVKKRRAEMPFDPNSPAKRREKLHQQKVMQRRRNRSAYKGTPIKKPSDPVSLLDY